MQRRDLIRGLGAAAAAGATATPAAGSSHWPWEDRGDPDHLDAKPDHVDLLYPADAIETYQPELRIRHLNVRPSKQYAWFARSPEYDYDVYCYWTWYTHQEGYTSEDSHFRDREPIYVYVDPQTGDVELTVYAAYHWLANRSLPPLRDETHPKFYVFDRYHHYGVTEQDGQYVDLEDFSSVFEDWLRNGWDESLALGVAQDPKRMLTRESWWRRDSANIFDHGLEEDFAKLYLALNVRGAGDTDLEN